ncbi:hypothetical protein [Methylovirgula sp. HY1]|uniref:hypothetical protein n=1 Tax=Methylovirgula sp. HY1 TaxID=2822761 RepID=UPI001C5A842C|nr:hypothetical protein [Methylovirgula sp. HY1]QXX74923.1 hypothetical protein MHY1_01740 [Methylovirgula sp. HY1]
MRVSLRSAMRSDMMDGALGAAAPLLDPAGPFCVLGARLGGADLVQPVVPSSETLFGPRGAALAAADGPLFVADTGHHRLLVWHQRPSGDHVAADFCIGQPDFAHEGRNAKGPPNGASFNVPTGVAATRDILAVADAWNHRVLIWHGLPERSRPADVVLGQMDFSGMQANRGGEVTAASLNWCYGVAIVGSSLIVCDTGNRRVLVWREIPTCNAISADLVLGQSSMDCRDENAGMGMNAYGMRWPHAVCRFGERLVVADSGNNRLMVWNKMPERNGAACDFVLGQSDAGSCEHNRAAYLPDARALNMPYACTALGDRLAVADTANSRLVGYASGGLAMGAAAAVLTGQPDFHSKGDNRWKLPVRDSLCWPYGLSACGDVMVVSDSGNNRVLLWRAAS